MLQDIYESFPNLKNMTYINPTMEQADKDDTSTRDNYEQYLKIHDNVLGAENQPVPAKPVLDERLFR